MTNEELLDIWSVDDLAAKKSAAAKFVGENRERLRTLQQYTRDELVAMVGAARRGGDWHRAVELSAWILVEYEPQHITGRLRPGGA